MIFITYLLVSCFQRIFSLEFHKPILTLKEQRHLRDFGRVQRIKKNEESVSAFIVVDSSHDAEYIWDTLMNIREYVTVFKYIKDVKIYNENNDTISAKIKVKFNLYANVVLDFKKKYKLQVYSDETRDNIFKKFKAQWLIDGSRVYLFVDTANISVIPTYVINILTKHALIKATNWLMK